MQGHSFRCNQWLTLPIPKPLISHKKFPGKSAYFIAKMPGELKQCYKNVFLVVLVFFDLDAVASSHAAKIAVSR